MPEKDAVLIQQSWHGRNDVRWPGLNNLGMIALTEDRHRKYCQLHDMDYWCVKETITDLPMDEKTWERVELIRKALAQGYQKVIWMDTDAIIKKPEYDLRDACVRIGMCYDTEFELKHYNCGVMYFDNVLSTRKFVDEWNYVPGAFWGGHYWHEQSVLNKNMPQYPDTFYRLPNKWNAYVGTPCAEDDIIVKAWHGYFPGNDKITAMKACLAGLSDIEGA
jgi:hypothetical protein